VGYSKTDPERVVGVWGCGYSSDWGQGTAPRSCEDSKATFIFSNTQYNRNQMNNCQHLQMVCAPLVISVVKIVQTIGCAKVCEGSQNSSPGLPMGTTKEHKKKRVCVSMSTQSVWTGFGSTFLGSNPVSQSNALRTDT
jgi:hypothetical protein